MSYTLEARLKSGDLPCIVATSSLELGLDLGAVDLVVQIETPPTISSGLQRVGRAGHQVGATSRGIILPKHRADLLASAAAVKCMHEREVEPTFYPRCPLDVLAQHIVAIVAMDETHVDALFDLVRRAANFRELGRTSFENLLDMLSGRYPSDDFGGSASCRRRSQASSSSQKEALSPLSTWRFSRPSWALPRSISSCSVEIAITHPWSCRWPCSQRLLSISAFVGELEMHDDD